MEKLIEKLKEIDIDVDSITACLGGNEALYLSICKKFQQDTNFMMFMSAIEANEINMASVYMHTLKGVTANLGFTRLNTLCKDIMIDLQNNDILFLPKKLQDITEEYYKIISILKADSATSESG